RGQVHVEVTGGQDHAAAPEVTPTSELIRLWRVVNEKYPSSCSLRDVSHRVHHVLHLVGLVLVARMHEAQGVEDDTLDAQAGGLSLNGLGPGGVVETKALIDERVEMRRGPGPLKELPSKLGVVPARGVFPHKQHGSLIDLVVRERLTACDMQNHIHCK